MMQLYFFGGLTNSIVKQVLAEVGRCVSSENIELFPTVFDLSRRLREMDSNPTLFVFSPENYEDLIALLSIRELLLLVPIILILPDQRPETVQYGHQLQPRFLTFGDSNLTEIGEVILNIKNRDTKKVEAEMTLQQRSLWAILVQCPFLAGHLPDCPLSQYREGLDLEEKFKFSTNQSLPTVQSILKIHDQCFAKRQEELLEEIPDQSPLSWDTTRERNISKTSDDIENFVQKNSLSKRRVKNGSRKI